MILKLENNSLKNIESLEALTNLRELNLNDNHLESTEGLER